jgi:hypothetical protein
VQSYRQKVEILARFKEGNARSAAFFFGLRALTLFTSFLSLRLLCTPKQAEAVDTPCAMRFRLSMNALRLSALARWPVARRAGFPK